MTPSKTTTAREIFDKTTAFFTEKGIPSPQLDAALLIGEVLGYDRLKLYLNFDRPMEDGEIARARELVRRRAAREPVAYILGRKEFAGRNFKVGPGILIPRPDTEILIDETVKEIKSRFEAPLPEDNSDEQDPATDIDSAAPAAASECPAPDISSPIRILEFGAGSGAIAVTLAAENPRVHVIATEINEAAAVVARENASTHNVIDRVEIRLQSDFAGIDGPFYAVVSNPPYIDPSEKPELAPDVANYEPTEALFADDGGLKWYKFLAREAIPLLSPGGFLAVEIGYRQREAVEAILTDAGLRLVRSVKDFAGHDRVVIAERI